MSANGQRSQNTRKIKGSRNTRNRKGRLPNKQRGIRRFSKAIVFPSVEDCKIIHEEIMIQTGDAPSYSAWSKSQLSFCLDFMEYGTYGFDSHPTLFEKTAYLMESIAGKQAFGDGNKRTATAIAFTFLRENDYTLKISKKEAVWVTIQIDQESITHLELVTWLRKHSHPC